MKVKLKSNIFSAVEKYFRTSLRVTACSRNYHAMILLCLRSCSCHPGRASRAASYAVILVLKSETVGSEFEMVVTGVAMVSKVLLPKSVREFL